MPTYLARIPEDPFSGRPFRYRLSKGEDILWPQRVQSRAGAAAVAPGAMAGAAGGPALPEPTRHVVAGQGILWSVGEDRQDDDAQRQGLGTERSETRRGEDLIYLVPLPATKPRQ